MQVISKSIKIMTKGEGDIIDLSDKLNSVIRASGLKNGNVTVFVPASTAAVTTIEYEPGLLKDLPNALERIAPKDIEYEHEKAWHDGNGHSHVRASILGQSLTIPFIDGKPVLGRWQQVVLIELDIRDRERTVIFQIIGE
jgi:secondary thiamine-phosphate synthase enzyme